jgi:hypothetical protein
MHDVTIVVLTLASISLLLWLFDFPYRSFRVEYARQQLREVRHALYAAADAGVIFPTDAAFIVTDRMLRGMIECAEEFGLWRALIMGSTERFWSNPVRNAEFFREYSDALNALTPDGADAVKRAMRSAHAVFVSHILHTSLLTFPLVVLVKLCAIVLGTLNCSLPDELFRTIDRGAYLAGKHAHS